jgi:hypothetical protein
MRERDMPERIAQGWSFAEEYEVMVPPGWVRANAGEAKADLPTLIPESAAMTAGLGIGINDRASVNPG